MISNKISTRKVSVMSIHQLSLLEQSADAFCSSSWCLAHPDQYMAACSLVLQLTKLASVGKHGHSK